MSRLDDLSPAKRQLLLAGVILITLTILAVLAEGAIRIRQCVRFGYLWGVEETYMLDPDSGLRVPIPNSELGPTKINSAGFRGPEIAQPKAPGQIRVAFLGASTTYCAEVSGNELVWPHIVVENLRAAFPRRIFDYINASVPGYSLESSLRNLHHRVSPLEPHVIVIYHSTNDISGNSYLLARKNGLAEKRTEKDSLRLSDYSLLVYLVEKNLRILANRNKANAPAGKLVITDPEDMRQPFRRDLEELVKQSESVSPLVALATFSTQVRR